MIASELFKLKISSCGATVTRPARKFRDTLISNCVIRSMNEAFDGMIGTASDASVRSGFTSWPAGQGDGQVLG